MNKNVKTDNKPHNNKINRKEAIKKAGGIAGLTIASIIFLDTKASAQGSSPTPPPTW